MIKFLVTALIVIICVFFMALMLCVMVWAITRLLRFLFPPALRLRQGPGQEAQEEGQEDRRRG